MESTRKTENTGSLQLQSKRTKYFHKEKLATFQRKDEKKPAPQHRFSKVAIVAP